MSMTTTTKMMMLRARNNESGRNSVYRDHGNNVNGCPDSSCVEDFNEETAKEWVNDMKNSDGTHGAHWSIQDISSIKAKHKTDLETWKLWTVMNMLYSDYCAVAAKYGVNTPEFFTDLAAAFLADPDAKPDKLARYHAAIPK